MDVQDILQVGKHQLAGLPALAAPLLAWYEKNARSLAWRENPTPYRVWISEIMLQQTRVEAVRGYYARFTEALPDMHALAAAPPDRLLKLWEGLGYYSRARNLQKTAHICVEQYGGDLPASYAGLLALPGIGPYTAGAVASIAFGIPVPAVDGNVMRVLSRLLASEADITLPAVKKAHMQLAAEMLPPERPGDFNQAMMELGATVCLPAGAPLCADCPLASACEAHRTGGETLYPVKTAKKARQIQARTVILVISQGKTLLLRRPDKGLLAGMLEPLNLTGTLTESEAALAVQEIGGNVSAVTPIGTAKHIFTHIEWRMTGYAVTCMPFAPPDGAVWADAAALAENHALPHAFRAYTKQLPELLSPAPDAGQ